MSGSNIGGGSNINTIRQPLGRNIPLPGGDPVDTPPQRGTVPGGTPGGLGTASPQGTGQTAGGIGDLPSPSPTAMTFDGSRRTLIQEHNRSKTLYQQTGEHLKKLDAIRSSLTRLSDKQDLVTMDDIIHEAGRLVGHGIDPMALAGLLADAPQEGGGEALGGWVATHAQTAMAAEQQMIMQHKLAQHQMGVSAAHVLMAAANAQTMLGGASPPIGQTSDGNQLNDLSPSHPDEVYESPMKTNALAYGARMLRKPGDV